MSCVQFLNQIDVSQLGYNSWPAFNLFTNTSLFSSNPWNILSIPAVFLLATGAVSFQLFATRHKPLVNQNRHFLYRSIVDLTLEVNIVFNKYFFFEKYWAVFFIVKCTRYTKCVPIGTRLLLFRHNYYITAACYGKHV